MLAKSRLTEAQLTAKLLRLGYHERDVRDVVERCRGEGYLDDALFARLFVECRVKAVGDRRLVADLVRRGIAREEAQRSVVDTERHEDVRLEEAVRKLERTRGLLNYSSAARSLERLGFPAAKIYRALRERADSEFDLGDAVE